VVNAIAHIDVKPPRRTKQRFVAGGAAAVTVAGGLLLGIHLRFHKYAPQQLATFLALHQQAADELGSDDLGGAGEEVLGEVLGGRGGYGCKFGGASITCPQEQQRKLFTGCIRLRCGQVYRVLRD